MFSWSRNPKEACKLKKSIHGLNQASRSWNLCFDEAIQKFGILKNKDEPCVYKMFCESIIFFLVLYVNYISLIGNDVPMLDSIKEWLQIFFLLKTLEKLSIFWGLRSTETSLDDWLDLVKELISIRFLQSSRWKTQKEVFHMQHGLSLSKTQCSSDVDEIKRTSNGSYASAIMSIIVCHDLHSARCLICFEYV